MKAKRIAALLDVGDHLANAVQATEAYIAAEPRPFMARIAGALAAALAIALQHARLMHDMETKGDPQNKQGREVVSENGEVRLFVFGAAVLRTYGGSVDGVSLWDLERDGELVYSTVNGEWQTLPPQVLRVAMAAAAASAKEDTQ